MRVLGFGYEGRATSDLVEFARSHQLAWVVDIRLTPLSRRAGFSKRVLAAALDEAGIGYVHLPALGNPRDNRAGFSEPVADGATGDHARARYSAEVLRTAAAESALEHIMELADEGVALLCFEAIESSCHRRDVLTALRSFDSAAARN